MDPTAQSHPNPYAVGSEVFVSGTLCAHNTSGGTEIIEHDGVTCRITKAFFDYEVGWRYHGTPIDQSVIEMIRQQATTEYTPDWYRKNRPGDGASLARAEKAVKEFDPAKVYFCTLDITPAPKPSI